MKRKRRANGRFAGRQFGRARAPRQRRRRGRFVTANGQELKFHDLDLDDAGIASAGTVTDSINLIAQGVDESERVGRKCTIRSIGWKFEIIKLTTTGLTSTSDVVRVIMFHDKQCNGATATVTGILESADYQAFNNLSNKSRFVTLMDRTYSISLDTLTALAGPVYAGGQKSVTDSFYKKCNIPVEFDADLGAITEIRSNNIGVLLISRGGNLSSFASKLRVRFSDN